VAVSRAIAGLTLFEPTAPERRSRLLAVN
jgi:hypothetical protein